MTEAESMAILFADICRSTQLYERLGDEAAMGVVARTLKLLKETAEKAEGRTIRFIGDEILAVFPSALAAGQAAGRMQDLVCRDPELCEHQIALRIGLHFGPIHFQGEEVYGDAVNLAARVVSLASQDQILTTEAIRRRIPEGAGLKFRFLGQITVKGKTDRVGFYEMLWRQEATQTQTDIHYDQILKSVRPTALELSLDDQQVVVDAAKRTVRLGRDPASDLVAPRHFVSRRHASIEFRNGKFILADHSTNGLFLKEQNSKIVHVHRDEVALFASGKISLGRNFHQPEVLMITYRVKEEI
jgi:class 3 adenylate cyclase